MVSKAREDLPEPESPVMTVREFRGISTLIFLRLCWRAPRITSLVRPMRRKRSLRRAPAPSGYTEPKITLHNSRRERRGSRRPSLRWLATLGFLVTLRNIMKFHADETPPRYRHFAICIPCLRPKLHRRERETRDAM